MNLIKASLLKPGMSLLEVDPNGAVAFIGEGTIGLYRVLVKYIPLKLKDMCFKRHKFKCQLYHSEAVRLWTVY